MVLKSNADKILTVELGGQDARRQFVSKKIRLTPHQRVEAETSFYTLAYVHVNTMPSARIGIYSPQFNAPYLIAPSDWKNIWVYGMRVILAGYITRKNFRKKAAELPVGSRVFQYRRTRTKNLTLPVAELSPLSSLLEQAKNWRKP
jgi:hypothetical protein